MSRGWKSRYSQDVAETSLPPSHPSAVVGQQLRSAGPETGKVGVGGAVLLGY